MDVQPGIIDRQKNKDEYLAKVSAAVDVAHKKQIPVVYVVVGSVQARRKSVTATSHSVVL